MKRLIFLLIVVSLVSAMFACEFSSPKNIAFAELMIRFRQMITPQKYDSNEIQKAIHEEIARNKALQESLNELFNSDW